MQPVMVIVHTDFGDNRPYSPRPDFPAADPGSKA
jgi:hypothetical protein